MPNLLRSRFPRISLIGLLVTTALANVGCSAEAGSAPDDESATDERAGSIGLELRIGDVTIDSLSYVITGNGFSKNGSIDVSHSNTVSALIGGIPAGTGYSLTLSGSDAANPLITCAASATFSITARATTTTNVRLECHLPPTNNGSLHIDGTANSCPRIDALSVTPAEVIVGSSMALTSAITDSDALPMAAGYAWTATGGTITGANLASASFKCTAAGSFDITLTVSDSACGDTASTSVTCSADPSAPVSYNVKVNEVESNLGSPGDWTELYNADSVPANISGWTFKDNDDTHSYVIPAGTTIPVGGYFVIEEAAQVFGLGSADSARLFNTSGTLVDSYSWTAHAATTYGRCPNGTGSFTTTTTVTKGAANDCTVPRPDVRINEVESNGGAPGDWTELYNASATAADVSGWSFKDNDDTHNYVIPAGTVIPVGGYYTIEEAAQGFGLGAADSVRLYDPLGALVDSYSWTAHAAVTYGRCPNGTGTFGSLTTSSKAAANACAPTTFAWPGGTDVTTQDVSTQFTSNLSGLTYEGAGASTPAVLWAVVNGPGTLFRMVSNGSEWVPDSGDWAAGKALRYTDGLGNPDSEGVTLGASLADGVYVATERNNDASSVSRLAVLRLDALTPGTSLTATHDWNLTAMLPAVGANLGLEAITWVPDSYLTGSGFFDEALGHVYQPSEYPSHGTGLFFLGVEGTGKIHVFALNHATGAASLLATINSGQTGVMGLEFDRELNYLWFTCDDTCGNKAGVFTVDTSAGSSSLGRFLLRRTYDRPSGLPNTNNEGFAIAPQSECSAGFKPVFWSDDNDLDGFSLRKGSLPCGVLF